MKTDECLFCVRIPLGEVLIHTYDLFEDEKEAYKIGLKTAEILKDAYMKDRFTICGKSPTGLLGGALYIASVLGGHEITQQQIAEEIGTSSTTIRHRYQTILKILHLELPLEVKPYAGIVRRRARVRCTSCTKLPKIRDWIVVVSDYFDNVRTSFETTCQKTGTFLRQDKIGSWRNCSSYEKRKTTKNLHKLRIWFQKKREQAITKKRKVLEVERAKMRENPVQYPRGLSLELLEEKSHE